MTRTFHASRAVRRAVPLLIGLVGPSGGGKTYSALRLATGIRKVSGGDIYYIDTEAKRALHYADEFDFTHIPFDAPFGSLDYLDAIQYAQKQGAKVIVVDSMSHEHEGPGGLLESFEAECDRIAGNDWKKRERVKFLAWQKPKQARRRLINTILQLDVNLIFCFRAKEKMKLESGKDPLALGWMPIAGEEFVYEMTVNLLLPPAANGVPELMPTMPGEKVMVKTPKQFESIVKGKQISETMGEEMARWAAGDSPSAPSRTAARQENGTGGSGAASPDRLQPMRDAYRRCRDAQGKIIADQIMGAYPAVEDMTDEQIEQAIEELEAEAQQ